MKRKIAGEMCLKKQINNILSAKIGIESFVDGFMVLWFVVESLKKKDKLALVTQNVYGYSQKTCNLFYKPQYLTPRLFSEFC